MPAITQNPRHTRADARPSSGLASWQERRVADYIETHFTETVTAADLSQVVRRSPGHFARAFKQSFGETPAAYVLRRRIARACELMSERSMRLCDIAASCGFSDQAHFSRRFRDCFGTPPSSWRRIHVGRSTRPIA